MRHRGIKYVCGSVFGFLLTSLGVLLLTGCLATDHAVDQKANENTQVSEDVPSGGDLIEIDSYQAADEYLETLVKKISRKLELVPLAEAGQSEEFEFRIWTNLGGLVDPELIGVRSSGSENIAYFFEMNRRENSIKLRRERLAGPKSGWNRMLFEVRSLLTSPKGLVRDPQFSLGRDEPLILLEVLDKGEYRRVFYGQNTTFQDGKRLIETCDFLAAEFDVNMNCHR